MYFYYLDNSGFAVIDRNNLLVFDCCLTDGDRFEKGYINARNLCGFSRVYFFVSHRHRDHFCPQIRKYSVRNQNTVYIVDKKVPLNGKNVIKVSKGDSFSDGFIDVTVCGSTDEGVSYLVSSADITLFHAGDLNGWKDDLTDFRNELDYIGEHANKGKIDAAFFPLDKRAGENYEKPALEFIERFEPACFVPMHMQDDFGIADSFARNHHFAGTDVFRYSRRGESAIFERTKEEQRKTAKKLRSEVDDNTAAQCAEILSGKLFDNEKIKNARCIMSYIPVRGEADVSVFNRRAEQKGICVVYPKCDGTDMTAVKPDSFKPGMYNIPEPVGTEIRPEDIDVILMPCTAFDDEMNRIGMGKGYYDRFTGKCRKAYRIGIAYDIQKCVRVHAEKHDMKADEFATAGQ